MRIKAGLVLILSLWAVVTAAQPGSKELDSTRFREQIIHQWWSCESADPKKECDMRLLLIKPDGVEMNCVNWLNGFSGLKSGYTYKLVDGFFEISVKEYPNTFNTKFIYGYLSESDQLFLLNRPMAVALSPRLLSEKGWLKFDKIKR